MEEKHFVKMVQILVTVLFKETLYLCIYFPGIESWIQSWVSWVEPGLPRKPSS